MKRTIIHQTSDFDLHPRDGWFSATCTCGFTEGPFPDPETMVDALMDHVALATRGTADLLFRLAQAIETYSNDQFKDWPEYQEAVKFFGLEIIDF